MKIVAAIIVAMVVSATATYFVTGKTKIVEEKVFDPEKVYKKTH